MLAMLRDLARHKAFANAALLKAIHSHDAAAQDDELRKILHHIYVSDRFWVTLCLGLPFDHEGESRIPESLEAIAAKYRKTHALELDWLDRAQESELAKTVETSFIPGSKFSAAQALMQTCLHSQGHRAQCAARLRSLRGTPPGADFIWWLKERPAADWS